MSAEQGTPNKSDKSTSRHCSVPRCNSRQANGISYHKLPTENRQRDEWIQLLKLGKNIKNAFICSLHFKKEDYISPDMPTKRPTLKKNVLPSQRLPKNLVLPFASSTAGNEVNGTPEDEATCIRKALFLEDTDGEFKFKDGKVIKFDKKLLCWRSKSPVFYQICFGPLSENVIEIEDFSYSTFQLFLNYIMGFNELTKESALEIFPVACKYLITGVIERCAVMLKPAEMNEDICNLLNMAFFYDQPILCSVVKEYIMTEGSPYGLLQNEKFSYLLSKDSFLEIIKWVTVDSSVLDAIVHWCDNFLKINKRSESIKELLHELGLIQHFKIDLFESGTSLYEFVESNLGKDIFPLAEVCKYFIKPEYSSQQKSKWVKMSEGQSFSEEFEYLDLQLKSYYNISFQTGKIVTYGSQNLDLSCTISRLDPSNEPRNSGDKNGIWINDNKKFNFSLLDWYNYYQSYYNSSSRYKYEIKYCFKQECRILVTNNKPRLNNEKITPLYVDKFYFTTSITKY